MFAVVLSQVLGERFQATISVDVHSGPAGRAFLSEFKAEETEARGVQVSYPSAAELGSEPRWLEARGVQVTYPSAAELGSELRWLDPCAPGLGPLCITKPLPGSPGDKCGSQKDPPGGKL